MKDRRLAFVDLETTSLDPYSGEILEVGIVLAEQSGDDARPHLDLISEHVIALIPEHIETANPKSLEICKYHERNWSHALTQQEGLREVARLLTDTVFVGQNVAFDWGYLLASGNTHGVSFDPLVHYHKLDLASMAFGKLYTEKRLARFSLRELAEYFEVTNTDAHTALSDARATFAICKRLLEGDRT